MANNLITSNFILNLAQNTDFSNPWLTFFSKIISSLAWPVTILIMFFLLKKPIAELIPHIKKFSAKGFEFEFGQELVKIQENIESSKIPSSNSKLNFDPEMQEWYNLIKDTIRDSPGYAVILTYSGLEKRIRDFAKLYDPGSKNPKLSFRPMNMLLDGLSKVINISPDMIDSILRLEQLRNQLLMNKDNSKEITAIDSLYYLDIATEIMFYIMSLNPQGPVPPID